MNVDEALEYVQLTAVGNPTNADLKKARWGTGNDEEAMRVLADEVKRLRERLEELDDRPDC